MSQKITRLLLVFSFALNIYFFLDWRNSETMRDEVSSKASALRLEKSYVPKKRHENNLEFIQDEMLPQDKSASDQVKLEDTPSKEEKVKQVDFHEFDERAAHESMKAWRRDSRAFIERDLGLDSQVADLYFEVREKRRKEIDEYFEPRMNDLQQDQTYIWSMEDNIAISKINERYLNLLKSGMGKSNYEAFKKFRQRNNRKSMENREGAVWIEF